ncbi:MAG TPA: hypothetical protein PKH10_03095 [bacterium]|nr:hypothetical protein [bacterium]
MAKVLKVRCGPGTVLTTKIKKALVPERDWSSSASVRHEKIIVMASVIFVAWALSFIWRTSFIAVDDCRYFCLFDDAMISLRNALNFVRGEGLVWNPGEYVEGYTNTFMVLIMALGIFLFGSQGGVLSTQLLAVPTILLLSYCSREISFFLTKEKDEQTRVLVGRSVFIMILCCYPLLYLSLMGMETGFLSLFFLFSILSLLRYMEKGLSRDIIMASFSLSAAFLTRNDSLILAAPFIGYAFLRQRKLLPWVFWGTILLGSVVGLSLFRLTYYGEILPNTYFLKLGGIPLWARIDNGVRYTLLSLAISAPLFMAVLYDWLCYDRTWIKTPFFATIASAFLYQIYIGGDAWRLWRMILPVVPLLFMLFALSMISLKRYFFSLRYVLVPRVVFPIVMLLVFNVNYLPEIFFLDSPFHVETNRHHVNIAIAISEVTSKNSSVGVISAGTIPYFSDRHAIDFLGKSDRYIARLSPYLDKTPSSRIMRYTPGHNKYDLGYSIFKLRPTYIQQAEYVFQDYTDKAQGVYVLKHYKGVPLLLLRNSPDVFWEKLN